MASLHCWVQPPLKALASSPQQQQRRQVAPPRRSRRLILILALFHHYESGQAKGERPIPPAPRTHGCAWQNAALTRALACAAGGPVNPSSSLAAAARPAACRRHHGGRPAARVQRAARGSAKDVGERGAAKHGRGQRRGGGPDSAQAAAAGGRAPAPLRVGGRGAAAAPRGSRGRAGSGAARMRALGPTLWGPRLHACVHACTHAVHAWCVQRRMLGSRSGR